MIYIKVDGDWYKTQCISIKELTMYEGCHAAVIYDDFSDTITAPIGFTGNSFWATDTPIYRKQVKLELFLQKGRFHEWSSSLHRFGASISSSQAKEL